MYDPSLGFSTALSGMPTLGNLPTPASWGDIPSISWLRWAEEVSRHP